MRERTRPDPVRDAEYSRSGRKLTDQQIKEIREALSRGERRSDLARLYGVTYQCIWGLDRGKTWKRKPRPNPVSSQTRQEVLDRAGYRCERCRESGILHLHHILRRSQGGSHDASNLLALCPQCHGHVHDHPAWAKAEGLLA